MTRTGELNEMAANVSAAQRRSHIGIGVGLLALVFVIVAGAFLLNRQLRPRVGIEAIAGPSALQGSESPASRTISSESEIGLLATPLQREVATAYLRYWTVYGAAMESLDSSGLASVADGARLKEASADIDDLRAEGVAAKFQVKHSIVILSATPTDATVRDEYTNSSYAVSPITRQALGDPNGSQHANNTYFLRRINGAWKVIDGVKGSS